MPKTTIQIDTKTRDKLQAVGKKGESYDKLIIRLLEELKELRRIDVKLHR